MCVCDICSCAAKPLPDLAYLLPSLLSLWNYGRVPVRPKKLLYGRRDGFLAVLHYVQRGFDNRQTRRNKIPVCMNINIIIMAGWRDASRVRVIVALGLVSWSLHQKLDGCDRANSVDPILGRQGVFRRQCHFELAFILHCNSRHYSLPQLYSTTAVHTGRRSDRDIVRAPTGYQLRYVTCANSPPKGCSSSRLIKPRVVLIVSNCGPLSGGKVCTHVNGRMHIYLGGLYESLNLCRAKKGT